MGRAAGTRRWGGALPGTLLLAQPVAAATPDVTAREIVERDLRLVRERALERSLLRLGVPSEVLDRQTDVETGRWLLAEPAGDLDGNGTDDVFEIDYRYRLTTGDAGAPSPEDETTTTVTARDGATGRKLWRKRYDTDVWPLAWRVGESGRPGALVIGNVSSLLDPAGAVTLSFEGLTGARGRRLWNHEYTSTSTGTLVSWIAANQLVTIGRMDAFRGKGDDLLLGLATTAGTLVTSTGATRTVVIAGADGREVIHPIVDVAIGWTPAPGDVGDLDGDGLDDVVSTSNPGLDPGEEQEPPAIGSMVHARKGADGTPIWSQAVDIAEYAYAWDLSDVAGTRAPEVGLDTLVNDHWGAYLLDGRSGRPWWVRPADWVHSPGDLDRDGKRDVVVTRWNVSMERGTMRFRQEAVQGWGKRLWSHRTEWDFANLPCPRGLCSGWAWVQPDDSSDLDPDAVDDMLVNMAIGQNVVVRDSAARVLDGRTGRVSFHRDAALYAPRTAIDGRGDDLVLLDVETGTIVLEAVDGRGRKLWGGPLRGPRKVLPRDVAHFAFGLRLPGDRCGDVLVDVFDGDDTFYAVLDGGSGRILWSRWSGAKTEHPSFAVNEDRNPAC